MPLPSLFVTPKPFDTKSKKQTIPVHLTNPKALKAYLAHAPKAKAEAVTHAVIKAKLASNDYTGERNKGSIAYDEKGEVAAIFWGIGALPSVYDGAGLCEFIQRNLGKSLIERSSFHLEIGAEFQNLALSDFCLGWGLAHYQFTAYKPAAKKTMPVLVLPKKVAVKTIQPHLEAIFLLRNLINMPASDLGTEELAAAAQELSEQHKAAMTITKGKKLESGFPMIHAVGKGSPRPPQLVEMNWGNKNHPRLTIVGKGLVYDTGGLNIKTGGGMRNMKKDMGGAAHALAIMHMIITHKIPVQLQVMLAIAENSTDGNSFRPGDILKTRKGLTVEIGDTDAEGRLCVAEALTYACEKAPPDLLVDFCTLTGSARVAVGYDIPAFFTNRDDFIDPLRKNSQALNDPIWPLPLWEGYEKNIDSPIADVMNDGVGRAGASEAALFLQRFITAKTPWIHLDCYAWEQNGKPGRPQGGADTGLRAMFDFIKKRYGGV